MLPSTIATASATQMMTFSVLHNSGHTHRYRRFALTLTTQHARLAEICVWFELHSAGLSPATLCQLAWHTAIWISVYTVLLIRSLKTFVYRKNQNPGDNMELEWSEAFVGADTAFGPRQLSNGVLRFICLATLLNQPEYLQPKLILIDEPELGLHPFALTILAEMIKQVADLKQVIIFTQSAELVSHFEPEDIVVIDRKNEESVFKRLDSAFLSDWLEDYTPGDLWKMNVFGGRP